VKQEESLNELALFAGAGGGILGGKLLGWRTVCAVEKEPYPASVLCARQNDGLLSPFPIWDDVQTFDGKPWRGIVDVVSGGFPCQDISAAGTGAGIKGNRSGLWKEMARIICEVRPKFVFVENSPMLTTRGLGQVLGDLASMGFNARWGVLGAYDVGAPHKRNRIWIVANANGKGLERHTKIRQQEIPRLGSSGALGNADSLRKLQQKRSKQYEWGRLGNASWWEIEPNVGRVANGVAARVDRLKAIGNGQVPLCAATAWRILNAA